MFRLSLSNCDPCLERECPLVNPTSGSGGERDWGNFNVSKPLASNLPGHHPLRCQGSQVYGWMLDGWYHYGVLQRR